MRRLRADLIEVFRIMRGLEDVPPEAFFQLSTSEKTRGHSMKLQKSHSRLNIRKFFFSQRIVGKWNALPESVIASKTVNQFKNGIAPLFRTQRSNTRSQKWHPAPVLRSSDAF